MQTRYCSRNDGLLRWPPHQSADAYTRIVGRLLSLHETVEDIDEQYETWI
ncbi:hypothetical protein ACFQH3_16710 [Haladaptatus sp. GCM10025707]|nr:MULTISPECIES: hypothetical protein [unclassified Haladaptatus]